MLMNYFTDPLFYTNIVLLLFGITAVCFGRYRMPRNSFFWTALLGMIFWRCIFLMEGHIGSSRYFMPIALLVIMFCPVGIKFATDLLIVVQKKIFSKKYIWKSIKWIPVYGMVIAIVLGINIAKIFHSEPKDALFRLADFIESSSNGTKLLLADSNIGLRLQFLIPRNIHYISYEKNQGDYIPPQNLQSTIHDVALEHKDFWMALSEPPKKKGEIQQGLTASMGIFPFDKIFETVGHKKIYYIFSYNHRIDINSRHKKHVVKSQINAQKINNEYQVDLSHFLDASELEFAVVVGRQNKVRIKNENLIFAEQDAAILCGTDIGLSVCNVFSWPIRKYRINIQRNADNYTGQFKLVKQAVTEKIHPGSYVIPVNIPNAIYIPFEGASINSENFFLPVSRMESDSAFFDGSQNCSKSIIGIPSGSGRKSLSFRAHDNVLQSNVTWKTKVVQPEAQALRENSKILFVLCNLEKGKHENLFKGNLLRHCKNGTVDFLYVSDTSFAKFATFRQTLEDALKSKNFDFVILNIGLNDVLWTSMHWLENGIATEKNRNFIRDMTFLTKEYPDTLFGCIVPQLPAPGEVLYTQGTSINWRLKVRGHYALSNHLYEAERIIAAKNFNVIPAFYNLEMSDYLRNTAPCVFMYTYFLTESGYKKIDRNIFAWMMYSIKQEI